MNSTLLPSPLSQSKPFLHRHICRRRQDRAIGISETSVNTISVKLRRERDESPGSRVDRRRRHSIRRRLSREVISIVGWRATKNRRRAAVEIGERVAGERAVLIERLAGAPKRWWHGNLSAMFWFRYPATARWREELEHGVLSVEELKRRFDFLLDDRVNLE